MVANNPNDELWAKVLQAGEPGRRWGRRLFGALPSDPRCSLCFTPFSGPGGAVCRTVLRRIPSNYNPRICNACDEFVRSHPGGAEVELTLLFADVRGSTTIAEGMSPATFSRLMDRFYTAATHAVAQTEGLIEKFVGDEVAMMFVAGNSGPHHARQAIEAARVLLRATGHSDPGGPWLPVGAGVHTGVAFVGSVGSGGIQQLSALGDAPNTAARLAANAGAGEILVSDSAAKAAALTVPGLEYRQLTLKGQSQPTGVYVLGLDDHVKHS